MMGTRYLHFVGRKHLCIYLAGDDGHHLQFHIYRWHSLSWLGGEIKNKRKQKPVLFVFFVSSESVKFLLGASFPPAFQCKSSSRLVFLTTCTVSVVGPHCVSARWKVMLQQHR